MKLFELYYPKKNFGNSKYFDYIVDRFIQLGYDIIGEGTFSIVFSKNKLKYVYKVYKNDSAYHHFIKYCQENPDKFLPKIYKIFKISDDSVGIIKLEKLYNKNINYLDTLYKNEIDNKINELSNVLNYDLDIKNDNILYRKNGIPVIVDPFVFIKNFSTDKNKNNKLFNILVNITTINNYIFKKISDDDLNFIKQNYNLLDSNSKLILRKYFIKLLSVENEEMTLFIKNILYENHNKILVNNLEFDNENIHLIDDIECNIITIKNSKGNLSKNLIADIVNINNSILILPETLKHSKIYIEPYNDYYNKYDWIIQ